MFIMLFKIFNTLYFDMLIQNLYMAYMLLM